MPQLFVVGQAIAAGMAKGRPAHEHIATVLADRQLSGALALRMFAYYEVESDTKALLAQTDSILRLLGTR
jgi:PII-like signaling protein